MKKHHLLSWTLALTITLGAAPLSLVKAEEVKDEVKNQLISAPISPIQGITTNQLKPYVLNEKEINTVFDGFIDEIESLKLHEGFYVFNNDKYGLKDSNVYVMISLGNRNTTGYGINVLSVQDIEGISAITIQETKPGSDTMVGAAITYPYIIVRFAQGTPNVKVTTEDGKELSALVNTLEFKEKGWINLKSWANVSTDKQWLISFNKSIADSTINENTIYVRDSSGKKVSTELIVDKDKNTVKVAAENSYEAGKAYYLFISSKMDEKNSKFVKGYRMMFTTKDSSSITVE